MLSEISYFAAGTAAAVTIAHPVEWLIHKYLLHAKPKLRRASEFIRKSSVAHNDEHHGAYRAPEHYYRDVTNAHVTVHFGPKDVAVIAAGAAAFGAVVDRGYALAAGSSGEFNLSNAAFILGTVTGGMLAYASYELSHHYMHVIGERRLAINRRLGDLLQGGKEHRDGNLRVSKPLLDDICTAVENHIDASLSAYAPFDYSGLGARLDAQVRENPANARVAEIGSGEGVLEHLASALIEEERVYRASLSPMGKAAHGISRWMHRRMRTSRIFKHLDNHHYLHHRHYMKNLNVVFTLWDRLVGSRIDSSECVLEADRGYWLCPNSPDEEVFSTKGTASTAHY